MAKPIRILHIVDSLGKGGLENGLVNLIENLDERRFEHVVYAIRALGPNADRLRAGNVRVQCGSKHDHASRVQTAALMRAVRGISPDIVHSRNWGAIEGVVAARCARHCAAVHSEHGLEAQGISAEPRRRALFRRLAYELANRVVSVSDQLRALHASRTGFRLSRIEVIHNGVNHKTFKPDSEARARVRRELGIGTGELCIGCVGNLFPVKDYPTLFDAVRIFAAKARNWRVVIAGEGPERPKLERLLARDPELARRTRLLGMCSQVAELLNAFDVYVLPSLVEGISNSLLEAMATGLPVVVTATGGNPEVVDCESGLLFPVGASGRLAEHLGFLHASAEARMRLGRAAAKRVLEEFSLSSMVRKYDELYQNVAAAGPALAAAKVQTGGAF